MKISTLIRRMDIFGVPIAFVGFNRLKYQTKLGGIMSIILIGWLSYNIVLQFVSMISKNTAVVITQTIFNDTPGLIQVDSSNFIFALQIAQPNYIKNPYFVFELEAVTVLNGKSKDRTFVSMAPCKLEDFQKLYFYNTGMLETLTLNDYKNWVCPQFGSQIFNLQGRCLSVFQSTSPHSIFRQIAAKPCVQNAYPIAYTCPTQQEVEQFVESVDSQVMINFMVSNINVNTASSNSYYGYIDRDIYMLINPQKQLGQLDIYLKNWDVMTNPNFINDRLVEHNDYIVLEQTDIRDRFIFRDFKNQSEIAKIYIRNSQYMFNTNRRYIGIGDFLAYAGGLFGSLYTIVYAVMSLYAYEQMWLKLFKIHYTLLAEDKECRNINEIVDEKFALENILIPNLKAFIQIFKPNWKTQVSTYFESQAIILEDLSIVSYLKLLKDVQKIKTILFTEKQLQIIDIISKDTIVLKNYEQQHAHKLEEGKKYLYGHKFQEYTLKQYKKIIDWYESLLTSKDQFQLNISKRLINILDPGLKSILLKDNYQQLKTHRTTMFLELPQASQQFNLVRDLTRIVNYEIRHRFPQVGFESLLKSIFFSKQTIQLGQDFTLQYESEVRHTRIIYSVIINNRFSEYNLKVTPKSFIYQQKFQMRKYTFECQILELKQISVEQLMQDSIEIQLNQHTIYFNCSLAPAVIQLEAIKKVPKDYRTQLQLELQDVNSYDLQMLSSLFHNQRFTLSLFQTSELLFTFSPNNAKVINFILNWPNSELLLNELVISENQLIQFLQVVYDLFIGLIYSQ